MHLQLKFLPLLAAMVSASAIHSETLLPRSGAGSTCTNWSLSGSNVAARCKATSGSIVSTTASLNKCVTNSSGKLKCGVNGNAAETCTFYDLFQSGTSVFISGECEGTVPGSTEDTINFDLNACYSNTNGQLTC